MKSERSRDASVEELLRRQGRADDRLSEACLDAEAAAAWLSGTLAGAELHAVEAHAADCSRCQAMLAALARTEPAAPDVRPWWSVRRLQWLAPITAAAAALALWFYVAPRGVPAPEQTKPIDRPASAPAAPTAQSSGVPPSVTVQEAPLERKEADKQAQVRSRPDSNVNQRRADKSDSRALEDAAAGSRAASKPFAAASAPAPPAPLQKAEQAGLARLIDIVSPDPSARWRVTGDGSVERSTDGGASWMRQKLPAGAEITAGSSPSADVCWLGGRAGVVLLSTDGLTWTLRALPEQMDIVTIRAAGPRAAEVMTIDGRRFTTRDGGLSWSPVRP